MSTLEVHRAWRETFLPEAAEPRPELAAQVQVGLGRVLTRLWQRRLLRNERKPRCFTWVADMSRLSSALQGVSGHTQFTLSPVNNITTAYLQTTTLNLRSRGTV